MNPSLGSISRSSRRRAERLPYALVLPALALILVFLILPILLGVGTSLFRPKGLLPGLGTFVGLDNYARLVGDKAFWNSLWVTLVYTAVCLLGTLSVGLGTALLLNGRFEGRVLARVIMTAPWAIPEVAAILIWVWMLNPNYGVVNSIASQLGLISQNIRWLNQVQWALPTVLVITIWKIFPFSTIVLLTALQGVPEELYEVAAIDGAGRLQSFVNVTLPGIRPTLSLLALLVSIWSLKRFSVIWLTTQGGPVGRTETLVILVYRAAFKFFDVGYAAAIGTVGLVLSMVITLLFFWAQKQRAESG